MVDEMPGKQLTKREKLNYVVDRLLWMLTSVVGTTMLGVKMTRLCIGIRRNLRRR